MKTRLKDLRLLVVLCTAFVTKAALGAQLVYTWTNNAPGDLATAANWNPNGVPIPGTSSAYIGDMIQFDGQSAGPVFATSNTGNQTGSSVGGTTAGIYVHLTANQASPVTFHTTVANSASSGIRFNSITIDAGAGTFYFGKGSTTNALDTIWGTSNPSTQGFTNNSANPAIIYPDVRWRLGAGGAHTFVFGGTGDWYVTNDIGSGGGAILVQKDGPGTMVWTAGHNNFFIFSGPVSSPLTISGGTLILKSSGLVPAMTTINNTGGLLVFDAVGGTQIISNPVKGAGSLQIKNGTLTLTASNTCTGATTISNGTLVVGSAGGDMNVSGGTLVPVGIGSIGTLNIAGNLNISSGTILASLNKSSAPSNSFVSVGGSINNSGGTLKLLNFGPSLVVGDRFVIFNEPVAGAALTIVSPGFTVTNNLAVDGSVTVTAVASSGTGQLAATISGGQLNLSWPVVWAGLHLQSQTNSLATGLSTNWGTIPGTDTGNSYFTALNNPNASVFYRLAP